MKKFIIRIVNVCVIVAALFGYNHITLAHEKTDAEAKAEADRQNAEIAAQAGKAAVLTRTEPIRELPQDLAVILPWK